MKKINNTKFIRMEVLNVWEIKNALGKSETQDDKKEKIQGDTRQALYACLRAQ
jgi:hypothetical protein